MYCDFVLLNFEIQRSVHIFVVLSNIRVCGENLLVFAENLCNLTCDLCVMPKILLRGLCIFIEILCTAQNLCGN